MRNFSPNEKVAIIREVLEDKASAYSVCKTYQISKPTFYAWLARFKATKKNRLGALASRVRREANHPRSASYRQKLAILTFVHRHPRYSCHQIAKALNVGHHAVQSLLERKGLGRLEARLEYAGRPFWKREDSDRRQTMMELYRQGWQVKDLCRHFKISKPTFIKWRKRFGQAKPLSYAAALTDRFVRGSDHHRFLGEAKERQVLDLAAANPKYSVHKLARELSGEVGHHGIQNVLVRHNLNTYDRRLAFAQEKQVQPAVKVAPLYEPQMPLYRLRMLLAPFVTVPKLLVTKPPAGILATLLTFLPLTLIFLWLRSIVGVPLGASTLGLIFASVALFFGFFFFLYSLKYYLTILMVLRLASSGAKAMEDKQSGGSQSQSEKSKPTPSVILSGAKNLILRSFGLSTSSRPQDDRSAGRVNPLLINLDRVKLDSQNRPFISIHVAVYNEKNVIERLIGACISQDWVAKGTNEPKEPNEAKTSISVAYEVVIVDDSTDETTEIAKQFLREKYGELRVSRDNEGVEIYKPLSSAPNLPSFTLIHRASRSGFKGGALQNALEKTDPSAEYVVVFDADFVPYPDTIEQFVKTFQVLNANEMRMEIPRINANISIDSQNSNSPTNSHSNIAVVQGYQWHVLNKSQTWVTRGVRTEYAGSYVIERSGEEIYGGLKQIAGAVYAIRADILREFGWGTSITEDFQLTLRLYEAGYKVAFTPYIQAPAEAVSTVRRLIRQRMRWAEGASFNVKCMLGRMLFGKWQTSNSVILGSEATPESDSGQARMTGEGKAWVPSRLTLAEKLEFVYLAPYYLQAAFFVVGTLSWFISEAVLHSHLPFWTAALGWSLVFTNLLSLPLMNVVGLFLEESDERDYFGVLSFIALSYIVVPFQAYAAVKGFLEREEGPWFRTPKTGLITDVFDRSRFGKFFGNLLGRPAIVHANSMRMETLRIDANERTLAHSFRFADIGINSRIPIRPRQIRWVGNLALGLIIAMTVAMSLFAPFIPQATSYASQPTLKTVEQIKQLETGNWKLETDPKNPVDKEEIAINAQTQEITTPRAIAKTTKDGKNVEFIFHQEPRVRVKLSGDPTSPEATRGEIEFETKTVFGKQVRPVRSRIYGDREVTYEEIVKDIDLKYSLTGDLLVEEFIIKKQQAISNKQQEDFKIEQTVKTIDVNVVSPDPATFGFYSEDGKELFKLSQPFAKDAKGEVSNDLKFTLDKAAIGYKLTKTLGNSAKDWLSDPQRQYPVSIDPSVIVSGGIAEAEVQFGGLQRKLAYMSGANGGAAWYALYNDATDVSWKRCLTSSNCDEAADWSAAQDLDTADAANVNPSISTSGNFIIVFWIDTSGNAVEGRRVDVNATTYPHTLGTLCTSASQGTLSSSFMVTTAAVSATEAVVAYSDTSTDTEVDVFDVQGLNGTCTITDVEPGNIIFGSGITSSDRPVLVLLTNAQVAMVFQDGDLSYSVLNTYSSGDEWYRNNLTIASVTDNIYSVTTDGTTVWVLTVSGTTATNFYSCCTDDFAETQIDADAGGNNQDTASDIDMFCVTSTDCKIVYTDDIDTKAPTLIFVDCDNEDCSTSQSTTIDSDIAPGAVSGVVANPAIWCVATDNCKIVYGDDIGGNGPDLDFVDCTSADQECSTSSITVLNSDIGDLATSPTASIDCVGGDTDCKVVYWEDDVDIVHFIDCSASDCSTTNADTTLDDNASGTLREKNSISCPTAADCKVVFYDEVDQDVTFVDCADGSCSSPAQVDIDTSVGAAAAASNDIWCPASDAADCKIVYYNDSTNDLIFVDCDDVDCAPNTPTTIDSADTATYKISIDCISVTDCKFIYGEGFTSIAIFFVDCDNAGCSAGSVIDLPGPLESQGAIQCLTTDNCKFAYYEGTASTNPTVQFADCDVTNCFPSATVESGPWTGQTNVSSVTLTLDTTNNNLYASIIKDTDEKAYWKSSPKSSILWGSENDWGWSGTGDHLGHISAPEKGADTSQIGVVLRETNNFEFAVVPEKTLFLLAAVPFLPKVLGRLKKKKGRRGFIKDR